MFMIVTRENDFPVFELELPNNFLKSKDGDSCKPLFQFILNASLDPIESAQWTTNLMYLKKC